MNEFHKFLVLNLQTLNLVKCKPVLQSLPLGIWDVAWKLFSLYSFYQFEVIPIRLVVSNRIRNVLNWVKHAIFCIIRCINPKNCLKRVRVFIRTGWWDKLSENLLPTFFGNPIIADSLYAIKISTVLSTVWTSKPKKFFETVRVSDISALICNSW
jgi:hypothetical protein